MAHDSPIHRYRWRFAGGLGLLVLVPPLILGTRNTSSPAPEPAAACVNPPAVPWTGPEAVLRKGGNGNWQVTWDKIRLYGRNLRWVPRQGEANHVLRPIAQTDTVRASIFPVLGAGNWCGGAFNTGIIVARIDAKGDYERLGLKVGEENYYFVYRTGSVFHSAVLNATTRKELPITRYKKHSPTADLLRDSKGTFTAGAYECAVVKKLKACFVDSPRKQNLTVAMAPGRFGIGLLWMRLRSLLQPADESQPWAACPEFGCCCGGTNCHPGS